MRIMPGMGWAERIIAARKGADLTQGELAERIGKKQSIVSDYEKGKKPPSLETFRLIAEATNCTAEWLIFGIGADGKAPEIPAHDALDREHLARVIALVAAHTRRAEMSGPELARQIISLYDLTLRRAGSTEAIVEQYFRLAL